MNKTSATRLLLPLVMASASVFVGCTNNDYDFNEIDLTLGLGGDELVIPTSSTKEIALDDILKLNEGDCVKILENGDYVFTQDGGTVDAVHPKIDKVNLVGKTGTSYDLQLDGFINNPSAQGIKTRAGENIEIVTPDTKVLEFEYDADQPDIVEITSAEVDASMTITVNFSQNISNCIEQFDEMILTLPEYMIIDETGSNVLRLTNQKTNEPLNKEIKVSKLDFSSHKIIDEKGHMHIDGELQIAVKTNVGISSDKLQYLNDLTLKSEMTLDNITINGASGRFNPEIDLTDLGDVEVSGTPDFLKDDGVVIDLANPQILVEINNDMDVAANINATLTSIKDGATLKEIPIKNIEIHPNALTKISICRNASNIDASYDTYPVEDLSELIRTIPDRIKFSATTTVDQNYNATINLGQEYNIEPSYSIVAPIAFGKDANIVYTDSIDGLYDDIDGLELAENAYIEVTADVENKLPVYLDTKVTPMDIDGNDLSTSIKIAIESNIPAAAENETAHGTIKITASGDIKQLDKLKFTIGGKATGDDGNSITGVTLNKNEHSLKLDNINAKIVGKVIYDAN